MLSKSVKYSINQSNIDKSNRDVHAKYWLENSRHIRNIDLANLNIHVWNFKKDLFIKMGINL